jgi:hypothetical protein
MAVKLNSAGYERAKRLIEEGKFTNDERTRGATTIHLRKSKKNTSERAASPSTANGFWQ